MSGLVFSPARNYTGIIASEKHRQIIPGPEVTVTGGFAPTVISKSFLK